MLKSPEIPAAIASITTEEAAWNVVGFDDNAIVQVGKLNRDTGPAYFTRRLENTAAVDDIPALQGTTPDMISGKQALDLRHQYDAQWLARPALKGLITDLSGFDFFSQITDDGLTGLCMIDDSIFTVGVKTDGALRLRVDDPSLSEYDDPLSWHEYRLPRRTSTAQREVHYHPSTQRLPNVRNVYNAKTITGEFRKGLNAILSELKSR